MCFACHSTDGSKLIGPSFKGIFGKTETIVTDGVEHDIVVDEDYLKRSILEPGTDIVKGYQPLMPPLPMTADEVMQIIDYIKELSE